MKTLVQGDPSTVRRRKLRPLVENPKFRSEPQYFEDGDFVTYFFKDDIYHAERVDELLTVYVSDRTKELIGCKIKGVRAILKQADALFVTIKDVSSGIKLGMLFMAAITMSEPDKAKDYMAMLEKVGKVRLRSDSLPKFSNN